MNFKLVSKNNVGAISALLLVVLLSQSKFFNFLFETALGRAILILFIIIISYMNKILGVVSVLFIIIMFNNSNLSHMEGFTDASNNVATDMSNNSVTPPSPSPSTPSPSPSPSTPSPSSPSTPSPSSPSPSPSTPTPTTNQATEGFDIIGAENNIKRGKQSNSIPVNDFMRESNSIAPYEGSSYSTSFHAF